MLCYCHNFILFNSDVLYYLSDNQKLRQFHGFIHLNYVFDSNRYEDL